MNAYTPSTKMIRDAYVWAAWDGRADQDHKTHEAAFDRWLQQVKAEACRSHGNLVVTQP